MKRIDYLEAAKLLRKKGIVADDATMLLATTYATGWRKGEIQMSWEDWLEEEVIDEDDDADEAEASDPTEPESEVPSPISMTRWPSSASSTDSDQQPTGT